MKKLDVSQCGLDVAILKAAKQIKSLRLNTAAKFAKRTTDLLDRAAKYLDASAKSKPCVGGEDRQLCDDIYQHRVNQSEAYMESLERWTRTNADALSTIQGIIHNSL